MKLSELKTYLQHQEQVQFTETNGQLIPPHFHITEAGLSTKQFVDCGGTLRSEKVLNFQIWVANDTQHRLSVHKLQKIIATAEKHFGTEDLDIEVEYQTDTIGRYSLGIKGTSLQLVPKQTDCLAAEECGTVPNTVHQAEKPCCGSNANCC